MSRIESFKDLIVYQKAYKLAMIIFELSKGFPKEEKYSLTDQIRRSSRSVTSNLAEAWTKRCYEKSFVNKLTELSALRSTLSAQRSPLSARHLPPAACRLPPDA